MRALTELTLVGLVLVEAGDGEVVGREARMEALRMGLGDAWNEADNGTEKNKRNNYVHGW